LRKNRRSLNDYPPMWLPSLDMLLQLRNHLIRGQLDYDISTENLNIMLPMLNSKQMDIFRAIVNTNDSNSGGLFSWLGVAALVKHIYRRRSLMCLDQKGR